MTPPDAETPNIQISGREGNDRRDHIWERIGDKWRCTVCGLVSDEPFQDGVVQ